MRWRNWLCLWICLLLAAGCGKANAPSEEGEVSPAEATAKAIIARANAEATAQAIVGSAKATAEAMSRRPPSARPTPTPQATPTPTAAPTAVPAPPGEVELATVKLLVEGQGDYAGTTFGGSGSIIHPRGYILTNAHVVYDLDLRQFYNRSGLAEVYVTEDPHLPARPAYRAKVVQLDREHDLAVLRVVSDIRGRDLPAGFRLETALPLGDSDTVQLGDEVRVFGFPSVGGDSVTYTRGVVSGFLPLYGQTLIKTDAEFTHGSSGGAAVDSQGRLIGVPTAGVVDNAGKVGYLVPINNAKAIIARALAGREIAITTRPTRRTITLYVDAAAQGYTGANVRARPSIDSLKVGYLDNGEAVAAYPDTVPNSKGEIWYKVFYQGRTAYILGSLLSEIPPTITDPEDTVVILQVDGGYLGYTGANVRERPTTSSAKIGYLPNGALVEAYPRPVTGEDGQAWYRVKYDGQVAYILGSLLREPASAALDQRAFGRYRS